MENLTEETVRKNYVYEGRILRVRRDDVRLPNGQLSVREIVDHPGGAGVLYVRDGKVLLVRQFRYAFEQAIYEIPAGKLSEGEDPKEAARRELSEEAGIEANDLTLLCEYYPTCGYSAEKIFLYLASGGVEGESHPDENEFLNVEYMSLDEVWQKIRSGEIKDSKTIIAVQHYMLEQRGN